MGSVQNFYTSRDNNTDPATYVGQLDRLWYNPVTNSIFVSDGTTPGGRPVALATGANIVANVVTLNTITSTSGTVNVVGNLLISGNISPASTNKIGGIAPGPGVEVSNQGILTIDTANLPLSFGNFTASNNILSIVNIDEDMILSTEGDAEIQLIGNVGFYRPDGLPPDLANRYAFFNNDGQVTFYVPEVDPIAGAVKIIGSATGNYYPPINTGVMLHITGQNNDASRVYNDSINGLAAFVTRRINGNIGSPTPVKNNDILMRISAVGYGQTTMPQFGSARIAMVASEDYTDTAQGGRIEFYTNPVGGNVLTWVGNVTVEQGITATKFNTAGAISATGNISGGNLILSSGGIIASSGLISTTSNVAGGNISTTGQVSATGNITAGNVNSYVALPAGTATKAPLVFTAGVIPATPVTGAMNYDGRIFYAVPQDSERGLIKSVQTYVLNSDYSLTDQSTVQSMFGVGTTVSTNTRYAYVINATIYKSSNNITLSYALDGNAVLARHTYQTITTAAATLATLSSDNLLKNILTTGFSTPVVVTASLNGAGYYSLTVNGIINVTTGGIWNPLVAFSGLPGAGSYVAAGSSIEIYPIGVGNATVSIGNWS